MRWILVVVCLGAAAPAGAQQAPGAVTAAAPPPLTAPAEAPGPAALAPDDAAADDAAAEAELAAMLAEETKKATSTRLNNDFVPGIVTVLDAEEVMALGAVTVWDALKFVPGIQPKLDNRARPTLTVRGVGFPFNNGNVKLLVDGVPLNRDSAGINSFVLQMPLEQVERIEVTRGPVSVAYGDFAFMGLVNIVTRKTRTGVFGRGASDGRVDGGASLGMWDEDRPFGLALGVTGLYGRGAASIDGLATDDNRRMAVLALRYGGFTLNTQYLNHELLFGAVTAPALLTETDWSLKGQYELALGTALKITPSATLLYNDLSEPVDAFRGAVVQGAVEAEWRPERRHVILVRGEYGSTTIDRAAHTVNAAPAPGGAGPQPLEPTVVQVGGHSRTLWAGTVQDAVSLTEELVLTPGARYDAFSDVAGRLTPRFSAAWQAAEHHIIKGQYAEGFRSPTFFELYGTGKRSRDLTFETNTTAELHYIYRRPSLVGRATLFRTLVEDMIYITGAQFVNDRSALAYGAEAEWEQHFTARLRMTANVSWSQAKDTRNDRLAALPIESAPEWMASLGLAFRPLAQLEAGAAANFVGATPAGAGYQTADVNAAWRGLGLEGLSVRAGVRNLFDDEVRYYAPRPGGTTATLAPSRTIWLQASFSE